MNPQEDDPPEKVMTNFDFFTLAAGLWAGKDWTNWTPEEQALCLTRRELVRRLTVAEYSKNQLWQARAAKNPHYWDDFYVCQVNLPQNKEERLRACLDEQVKAGCAVTVESLLQAFGEV